jgi:hypothetical protein
MRGLFILDARSPSIRPTYKADGWAFALNPQLMINFNNLSFERLIVHHIIAKLPHEDTASASYENDLFEVPLKVEGKIKERLLDAAGKNSKAFELELESKESGSFFDYAKTLRDQNNKDFIKSTQEIADLLALSQTRNNIPGGNVIIIDAIDKTSNHEVVIVIKAELHEAFQQKRTSLALLDNIFLSPSQKLFKIGILYAKNKSRKIEEKYGCYIVDDQFRADSQPAEYFYKTFLGFTIGNNSKIQSKRFYDKTHKFIKESYTDSDVAVDLVKALKIEFSLNTEKTITPRDFANKYFEKTSIRDSYISEVANELPGTIVKDSALLESLLNSRKLTFPNNIRVVGPEEEFEENVKMVNSKTEFNKLDFSDSTYSIIRIAGKPSLK